MVSAGVRFASDCGVLPSVGSYTALATFDAQLNGQLKSEVRPKITQTMTNGFAPAETKMKPKWNHKTPRANAQGSFKYKMT